MRGSVRCCGGMLEVIEIIGAAALRRLVRRLAVACLKSLFLLVRRLCGGPQKEGVPAPPYPL